MTKIPTVRRLPSEKNAWTTRIRFGNGQRQRFTIMGCRTEEQALARAASMAEMAATLIAAGKGKDASLVIEKAASAENTEKLMVVRNLVRRICSGAYDDVEAVLPAKLPPETSLRQLGALWTDGELHRRWPDHVKAKRSVKDDVWRLAKYVNPIIGDLAAASFTLDDANLVMSGLPRTLSAATRRHIAQLLVRLGHLAVFPAQLRKACPIPRGWLPKTRGKKQFPILMPDEDSTLLANTAAPLLRRLFYGFLHREGVRRNDAATLRWRQLDLVRGTLRIEQDKTDHSRMWRLDAGVAEALRRWKDLQGRPQPDGLVFVDAKGVAPDVQHLATHLRADLKQAGVDRDELFE
jgi:integrase